MPRKYIKQLIVSIVLVIGLFATVKAVQVGYRQFITAEEESMPQSTRLTNLSDNSASLSWITDKEVTGFIVWGTKATELTQSQRAEIKSKTHYFTLRNLTPNTLYYYKMGTGGKTYDNNGSPYTFTTAPIAPSPPTPDEVYGKVKTIGDSVGKILIFLTIKDQDGEGSPGTSTTLSAVTSSSGSFIADLGNSRTADLNNYFSYSREKDYLEIEAEGADQGKARVLLTTAQTQPLPDITLTETGALADLTGKALTGEQKTSQETRTESQGGFEELVEPVTEEEITEAQEKAKPKIELKPEATLEKGDFISGTASPGATLTIKIESPGPIITQVRADENGNWQYQLPSSLGSGSHTITASNNEGSDTKGFVIAAADAIPTATPTASPTASPSSLPVTANFLPTVILLISSILFLILGTLLFYLLPL